MTLKNRNQLSKIESKYDQIGFFVHSFSLGGGDKAIKYAGYLFRFSYTKNKALKKAEDETKLNNSENTFWWDMFTWIHL